MSSFQIENSSNDTVYVAVAYNRYNGNLVAEGWWQVAPNSSQNFSAPDSSDLHLRVQSPTGDDLTFGAFTSFLWWTIPQARFTLSREADGISDQILRWGNNLENTLNRGDQHPFPNEWSSQRFFQVGPGTHSAQIRSPVGKPVKVRLPDPAQIRQPAGEPVDDCWPDDAELIRISRRHPSTPFGAQLMRDVWPGRYASQDSSDSYRGCAVVLSMLCASMRRGISISEIDQVIETVRHSITTLKAFPPGSDRLGGALLTITNAWECAHCGYTGDLVAAAYESKLIYAAKMFVAARQHGL